MKIVKIGKTNNICRIQKYKKSKRLSLSVADDGNVRMSIPHWVTYRAAIKFLQKKEDWVLHNITKRKNHGTQSMLSLGSKEDYLENRETARNFVQGRIDHFNKFYCLDIGRISIKNQKTRWGSCSSKNNLNFNYRIIFLTPEQSNYLIVHELCHLRYLNHSRKFWQCVGKTIPDYKQVSRTLRNL